MTEEQNNFFTQLYLKEFNFLYDLACALLSDSHLGYDLVQETFQVACLKIESVMKHPNPAGWLVVVLKHKVAHIFRDKKILLELNESITAAVDDTAKFEECEDDWKKRWLEVISESEFQLLQKYYGQWISISCLAEELGISVDSCYKRIQRAKKKLRKIFE